jgi:hypothetical protein
LATLVLRKQFRQQRPSTGIKVLGFAYPIDSGWATYGSAMRLAESWPKAVGLLNVGAVHGATASLLAIRMPYRFSMGTPLLAFKLAERSPQCRPTTTTAARSAKAYSMQEQKTECLDAGIVATRNGAPQ